LDLWCRSTKARSRRTWTKSYDQSDPAGKDGTATYGLDPVGNRLSLLSAIPGLPPTSSTFSADDLLSSESYDTNGNASVVAGSTYGFNSQNQLVSADAGAIAQIYDGFGNRVAKAMNGVTTQYLVEDDVNPTGHAQVFDELTNGIVNRTYTYGLQRISETQFADNTWTTSYYGYDGGGNVRNLTNSVGAVTDTYEYDAFGNLLSQTGTTPNLYRYRGEQYDSDLDLYYLRARWYNPATGRFLSQDPLPGKLAKPATLHRYNYARANPVNRIDPSGREDLVEEGELDEEESVAEEAEEEEIAEEINCDYDTDASLLYAAIDYNFMEQELVGIETLPEECEAENEVTEEEPINCDECFAAGTSIHTDQGDVPIEKVKVGDEVEARNSETGKLEPEPITALTPIHKDSLLEIRIEGERSPLRPSTHHPFWARHGDAPAQWINSADLRIGDSLLTIDGNWRAITAITPAAGQETVYNFTVANDHDYFVGETGFLVHNAPPCGCTDEDLDWSRPRPDGDTTPEHVMRHFVDDLSKPNHGVFADDPITTAQLAWEQALQDGTAPVFQPQFGNWAYDVAFPEAGLGGGYKGNAEILNKVRIVLDSKCRVVTAFPHNMP
jgi:RHS repeat-associated protein